MNLRSEPLSSLTGVVPFQASSSMEPRESAVGPEMVPVPSRSPVRMLQPLTEWCTSCCLHDQYMYLRLERDTTWSAAMSAARSATSRRTSYALGSSWCRYGSGVGSVCSGPAQRNGSSASSVTTHGEMVVAKFLPRNGPSGTYSHFWMSRADQSFMSTRPNMCCLASRMAIGWPSALPAPTTAAISSSKSTRTDGPNVGGASGSSLSWPCGRTTSVPDTTTDDARPW
mmetsp:Transcript_8503/g.20179  ORF Transcript_8503/g.20179 Transcript_8503/m.20179 type:complete len:227 (+) Transcript_8503:105-785(+)